MIGNSAEYSSKECDKALCKELDYCMHAWLLLFAVDELSLKLCKYEA